MTTGPDTSKWRASPIYDYVDNLVDTSLAWEWLRRNGDYQRDYRDLSQATDDGNHRLMEKTHTHWGLRFPSLAGT